MDVLITRPDNWPIANKQRKMQRVRYRDQKTFLPLRSSSKFEYWDVSPGQVISEKVEPKIDRSVS